ncbi:tyrosine-type recombinase/integrase [Sulfitobacter sp. TBRI5]|uniref:tyrosine-type recombinase/integrase n=1 Tax=Sulfitobacter sp. TBRI5 TaxID=2989732 RepID=UPI003D9B6B98
MRYIDQPRGAGTAYRFKMKTPKALAGMIDPLTKKKFGNWIIRPFGGERHLPTAKKLRDICVAEVRTMTADAASGAGLSGRFNLERAEGWAEALRVQKAKGGPDDYQPDVYDLIEDEVRRAPKARRKAFQKVALSGTLSMADAVTRYLHDRRPNNGFGYATLAPTTQKDMRVAVKYLCEFMQETEETLFLEDVDLDAITRFRNDFLPQKTSPRAPVGLSYGTIEKLCGFLRTLWKWAVEHRHVNASMGNPFDLPTGVRKQKRRKVSSRDIYNAEEAEAIMKAFPLGNRLGDIFRLALVSGCRATELAKVTIDNVSEDGAFYYIAGGKTDNATRTIPVPEIARDIVLRRLADAKAVGEDRLFHDYPIRPSTDKVSSLSQEYTRQRRAVLGADTDGRLTFHSLRHTWFTKARQAGVSVPDANDLGGWAGERTSSSSYDHGLMMQDLAKKQELVAERLKTDGYLKAF